MVYTITSLSFVVIFLTIMVSLIALGNTVGRKTLVEPGLTVTEGAVFTLMALLVAFVFASASSRFDHRRALIIEEANATHTAYLRLAILQPLDQAILGKDFLSYLDSRLAISKAISAFNLSKMSNEIEKSKAIQNKLWLDAVNACKKSNITVAPMFVLSPINQMFDLGNERMAYTYFHTPYLVLALLSIVSFLSAFLTGYGIGKKGTWRSLHVLAFVLIITTTVYVILDLEAPRFGLIKEAGLDYLFTDVKNDIAKSP